MKEFTPPGIHLLGPASMAWASILAQNGKSDAYNALMLLKPTSMCSEHQNHLGIPFLDPNLVKICKSYDKINFS